MKQKMKRISFIRLIGNHTLSCAILGINCTPNGLKLHKHKFHPLLMQLSPNCAQKHANYLYKLGVRFCNSIRLNHNNLSSDFPSLSSIASNKGQTPSISPLVRSKYFVLWKRIPFVRWQHTSGKISGHFYRP